MHGRPAPLASGSPPLPFGLLARPSLTGLVPPHRFPLSPHRRTYAQCTTGLARTRIPVEEPAPAFGNRTQHHGQEGDRHGEQERKQQRKRQRAQADAAIVNEHDPASSAGLALLWDGLTPAVTNALGQPIDPGLVSQRKGRGGRVFDYLEGHVVIDQANCIFGYGGWGYELVGDVTLRRIETVDTSTGEVKVAQGYSAPVRVTVAGALPRTDTGVHPVMEDTLDGHDTAIKGAVTDGMKRAFRSFGVQFGNGFYGDQPQTSVPVQPERVPAKAKSNGNSGQAQASRASGSSG